MIVSRGVRLHREVAVLIPTSDWPSLCHLKVGLHRKEVAMQGAPTLNHPKVGLHRKEVALRIAPTLNHPRVGLPRAVAAV
jgi:hypothetical protein